MIKTIEITPVFSIKPVTVSANEFKTRTTYVRAIGYYSEPPDLTTVEMMSAIEASGTLDFWNDPIEDIYSEQDGDDV